MWTTFIISYIFPIECPYKQKKKQNLNTRTQKKKWARFTYVGKETRYTTKVFKDTNVAVAFTTNNTIRQRLSKEHNTQCKYEKSSVYQLTCPNCKMTYTGQTGRPFKTRFQEHARDFRYNNRKSAFAQHLLDNGHSIGKMEDIMKVVHIKNKGRMLNALENYHIYIYIKRLWPVTKLTSKCQKVIKYLKQCWNMTSK